MVALHVTARSRLRRVRALAPRSMPGQLDDLYGPFASAARRARRCGGLAAEARAMLEPRWALSSATAPASRARCVNAPGVPSAPRPRASHHARLRERWRRMRVKALALCRERSAYAKSSLTGERTDIHVLRDWCWLGTARDEGELQAMLEAPPRGELRSRHLPGAESGASSRGRRLCPSLRVSGRRRTCWRPLPGLPHPPV